MPGFPAGTEILIAAPVAPVTPNFVSPLIAPNFLAALVAVIALALFAIVAIALVTPILLAPVAIIVATRIVPSTLIAIVSPVTVTTLVCVTLLCPISAIVSIKPLPRPGAIVEVNAVAGIVVIVIPAAAIAYIGKTIARIAVVIAAP